MQCNRIVSIEAQVSDAIEQNIWIKLRKYVTHVIALNIKMEKNDVIMACIVLAYVRNFDICIHIMYLIERCKY